jgi:hypothetical protein
MEEDPYQILNLSHDASLEEVKKAYFYIAQIYHPNKGGSEQQFLRFQNAYNCIVNRPTFGNVAPRDFVDLKNNAGSLPNVNYTYNVRDFQSNKGFDNHKFNANFNTNTNANADDNGYTYNVNHLVNQVRTDRNLVEFNREYDQVTMEAENITPMFDRGFDQMTFNKVFQHMRDQHKSTDIQEYTEPSPSTSKEIISCVNLDRAGKPDAGHYASYNNAYDMHQNPSHYDKSFIERCKTNPDIRRDDKLSQQELRGRMNTYHNTQLTYNTDRLMTDRNSYLQEMDGINSVKAKKLMQDNSTEQFQKMMSLRAPVGACNQPDNQYGNQPNNQPNQPNNQYDNQYNNPRRHRKHKSNLSTEIKDIRKLVKEQQKIITHLMNK